jgi:hypothetical protein
MFRDEVVIEKSKNDFSENFLVPSTIACCRDIAKNSTRPQGGTTNHAFLSENL